MFRLVIVLFIFKKLIAVRGQNYCEKEKRCCVNYKEYKGRCIPCNNGTFGINCASLCPIGYYGYQCQSACKCDTSETCSPQHGCIQPGNFTVHDADRNNNHVGVMEDDVYIFVGISLFVVFAVVIILILKLRSIRKLSESLLCQNGIVDHAMRYLRWIMGNNNIRSRRTEEAVNDDDRPHYLDIHDSQIYTAPTIDTKSTLDSQDRGYASANGNKNAYHHLELRRNCMFSSSDLNVRESNGEYIHLKKEFVNDIK